MGNVKGKIHDAKKVNIVMIIYRKISTPRRDTCKVMITTTQPDETGDAGWGKPALRAGAI